MSIEEEVLKEQGADKDEAIIKGLRVATGHTNPPEPPPIERPEWDAAFVALVEERWKSAEKQTWLRRKEGLANVEFFLGRQWSHWNDERKRYVENSPRPQNARYSPKTTINVFQSIVRTAISRFLSAHPRVSITAASSSQAEIDAARKAQRVVGEYEWEKQDMDSVLASLVPHVLLKGDALLKVTFDPLAGEPREPKPMYKLDENMKPVEKMVPDLDTGEWVPSGELEVETDPETGETIMMEDSTGMTRCEVVDSHLVAIDPTVTELNDASWIIEERWLSPAYIQNRYPGKYVQPSSEKKYGDDWSRSNEQEGAVQVLELWCKKGTVGYGDGKSLSLKTGYMVVIADGKVLERGPNNYRHGRLPYFLIRASRIPGSIWGDTFMNAVRGIQHAFNLCCSQVALSNALMAGPVWLTNSRHQIKQVAMTSTPGGIVEAEWGLDNPPPQRLDGRSIASSAMGYLQFLFEMMQDVSGQHQGGLMGGNAPGAESGVHIAEIQERDLAKLGSTAQEIARALKWWAEITLLNWSQFKSEDPEQIALNSASVGADTIEFSGTDVYDSFAITVAQDGVLPQTRSARFNKNFVLWQNGIISKRDLLHRIGDEADEETSLSELHASRARDENRLAEGGALLLHMKDQAYVDRMTLDDVEIHYDEHMRKILDPTTPDEVRYELTEHLKLHDAIAMMAMMQMNPAPPASQEAEAAAEEEAMGAGPPQQPPPGAA